MRVIKSIEDGKASNLVAQSIRNGGRVISPQYKTTLCNQAINADIGKFHLYDNLFYLKADCKFGSVNCNFAHSEEELRTVQENLAEINPNYKGNKMFSGNIRKIMSFSRHSL